MTPLIYHGRFGGALFQSIYRNSSFSLLATALSFEWHLLTLFLFSLGIIHGLFVIPGVLMIAASAWVAVTAAYQATLPPRPPWWSRPLIAALHVIQPIARSLRRYKGLYRFGRLPRCFDLRMRSWLPSVRRASESISRKTELADLPNVKCISRSHRDLYWLSRDGVGRESLLSSLLAEAKRLKWAGDFDNPWSPWDLSLVGDIWHRLTIRSVSEELGNNERFTRVRISTQPTVYLYSICAAAVIWLSVALCTLNYWAIGIGIIAMLFALLKIHLSRQFCLSAACVLSAKAAELIDLPTYDWRRSPSDVVRLDESNELPPRKQRELEQVGP